MSDIAHSLVRRAVDVTQQHYANEPDNNDETVRKIAIWGIVLLWATALIYVAMVSAVSLLPINCCSCSVETY